MSRCQRDEGTRCLTNAECVGDCAIAKLACQCSHRVDRTCAKEPVNCISVVRELRTYINGDSLVVVAIKAIKTASNQRNISFSTTSGECLPCSSIAVSARHLYAARTVRAGGMRVRSSPCSRLSTLHGVPLHVVMCVDATYRFAFHVPSRLAGVLRVVATIQGRLVTPLTPSCEQVAARFLYSKESLGQGARSETHSLNFLYDFYYKLFTRTNLCQQEKFCTGKIDSR